MSRYARTSAACLLTGILLIGALLGQTPVDIDPPVQLHGVLDLVHFRLLLAEESFQQEVANGFTYGPCRLFQASRLSSPELALATGRSRSLHGMLVFGEPAESTAYRLRFFHRWSSRSARLWLEAASIDGGPGAEAFIRDETAFRFLLHVLDVLPAQIVDPLVDGELIGLRVEHDPSPPPGGSEMRLSLHYRNAFGELSITVLGSVVGNQPLEFGDLTFE